MQKSNVRIESKVLSKLFYYLYNYGIYFIFVLLIVFFALKSPMFIRINNIINIVQQSAALGIVTVGMTFILLTGNIDISVASTMLFSSTVAAWAITNGFGLLPAIIFALLAGTFIGAINGFFISKMKIVSFIATLATFSIGRGLAILISKTKNMYLGEASRKIAETKFLGIPVIIFVFLVILVVGEIVLKKTQFGKQLFALGYDKKIAAEVGINVQQKIFLVFVITGILAAIGGIILSAQVGAVTPNFSTGNEFVIISAAVLGGTSLFGGKGRVLPNALIGILTITIIINGLTLINASPFMYQIVRGIIIFLAVFADSLKNSGDTR